jgi:hypothetical protein
VTISTVGLGQDVNRNYLGARRDDRRREILFLTEPKVWSNFSARRAGAYRIDHCRTSSWPRKC